MVVHVHDLTLVHVRMNMPYIVNVRKSNPLTVPDGRCRQSLHLLVSETDRVRLRNAVHFQIGAFSEIGEKVIGLDLVEGVCAFRKLRVLAFQPSREVVPDLGHGKRIARDLRIDARQYPVELAGRAHPLPRFFRLVGNPDRSFAVGGAGAPLLATAIRKRVTSNPVVAARYLPQTRHVAPRFPSLHRPPPCRNGGFDLQQNLQHSGLFVNVNIVYLPINVRIYRPMGRTGVRFPSPAPSAA